MTDTRQPPTPAPGPDQAWRNELMDLGGPNTLIWPRRDDSETVDLGTAHPGGIAMLLAGRDVRISDLVRESDARLRAQRAARRLRARTEAIAEEHGLTTCFLAMGTATWHTGEEGRRPAAPVLLRRCELRPSDSDGDLRLVFTADVELNPALTTILARRTSSPHSLTRLVDRGHDTGRGFNPDPVYAALRELCADIPGLEVSQSLMLAAYPYGKGEGIADLAAVAEQLTSHRLVRALTAPSDDPPPARRPAATRPREGVDDSVFDLPADQQAALDRIGSGDDLVVEAPPGVDAARFVAATIAQAARTDRTVLLLTEKSAAVRAVQDRLSRVGLADLVLHVDDPAGQVDPRLITERWPAPTEDEGGDPHDARTSRDRAARAAAVLDGHASAMHTVREPWGVSVADAHDAVVALAEASPPPRSRMRLSGATLRRVDLDAVESAIPRVERVARAYGWERRTQTSAWWRADLSNDKDSSWLVDVVGGLLDDRLAALDTTMTEVFRDITEPQAQSPADHGRYLAAIERVRDTTDVFRPEIFDGPITPLVEATDPAVEMGRLERRRLVRQARSYLRPGRPPADLHAALVTAQEQRESWARLVGGGGRPRIPATIDDAHRAYESVHDDLAVLDRVLAGQDGHVPLVERPTTELVATLKELRRDAPGCRAAVETRADVDAIDELGLGDVLDDLARRRVPVPAVGDELRFVWWMSLLAEASAADERYGATSGDRLAEALADFVSADEASVAANARDLAASARERFRELGRKSRRLAHSVADAAEGRGGREAPRWSEAVPAWGPLLRAGAPCWAMSPLAVGLVLPPRERFDVVVVDDASRTTLARVASGLCRGSQLVVVGDALQQGPATYTTDPGVLPPAVAAEPFVEVAARVLDQAHLRTSAEPRPWYPSAAHERGIVHVPAPHGDPSPTLRAVPASEGGASARQAEADLVARIVVGMLADPTSSIGVVTFDAQHAESVRGAVRDLIRRAPELGRALGSLPEPFVVKPAERWQRDQRDRVVVAVGLTDGASVTDLRGPAGTALVGPTGERLLRTAVTRARTRSEWVTSVDPAAVADELGGLRDTLVALRTPAADRAAAGPGPGALVDGFVRRLRAAGLRADTGVGQGVHRVDIAVGDAERRGYQVAVSLDRQEHTTRAGARARDRVLPGELTALGWHHLRLWETDLFADPARQEAKVVRAVQEACARIDAERRR